MSQFESGVCVSKCNEIYGRYIIAARDLKPGELVLCEKPVLFGPTWHSELCCVNCYRESMTMCKKCKKAPLCLYCLKHDQFECDYFKTSCLPDNFLIDYFDTLTPIRCLLLGKKVEKSEIYQEFLAMESHCTKRKDTTIWKQHEDRVVNPLDEAGVLKEFNIDRDFMQKICGILDVNTFEIRPTHFDTELCQLRGLFLKTAILAHDCAANTFINVDTNHVLRIHTSTHIKAGEMISTDYTDVMNGTLIRRDHLLEGKYFLCTCNRCNDPTELGTHMSSMTCKSCNSYVFYEDNSKIWKCSKCSEIVDNADDILRAANDDFCNAEYDVDELENCIEKYSKLLNPNHYLVLKIKQTLAGILRSNYGECKTVLKRQIELCSDIINTLEKLQPGISRLRGIALYEQYNQQIRLSTLNYNSNEISIADHLTNLQNAEYLAKESINMLLYEPACTPEGKLSKKAMSDLKTLRLNIKDFQEICINNNNQTSII